MRITKITPLIREKITRLILTTRLFVLWGFLLLIPGCSSNPVQLLSPSLNSRFPDEQPALSGDGNYLALVSSRQGQSRILVYDLKGKRFIDYPGLNTAQAVAESPSFSRTGRYLVFISSFQGKPDIALYDRATTRVVLLTQTYRGWVRNPHISPDGRYIVFETSRRGQWDIEMIDRGPNIELDIADGTPVTPPP